MTGCLDIFEINNEEKYLIRPSISSFYPDTLRSGTGDTITIIGTDFGALRGNSNVKFRSAHEGPTSSPVWIEALIFLFNI